MTTTRRLLDYCRLRRDASWSVTEDQGATLVNVSAPPFRGRPWHATSAFDGLSFYVSDPARTRVTVNGQPVTRLQQNPKDETGRPSVSIPWRRLTLPGS